MRLAVFGATGLTGLQLVEQALARGHHVTAIVRNAKKLERFNANDNFKAVSCDILNANELAPHLANIEAVLSGLGAPGIHLFKITLYKQSIVSIVNAMRKNNVKRLLAVTSMFSKPNEPNYPGMVKIVLRPMIGRQLDSMNEMEEYLVKEAQDLEWILFRPPRLLDGPLQDDAERFREDEYFFSDYSTANAIPRANVARAMLDNLDRAEWFRRGISVDMPKKDGKKDEQAAAVHAKK